MKKTITSRKWRVTSWCVKTERTTKIPEETVRTKFFFFFFLFFLFCFCFVFLGVCRVSLCWQPGWGSVTSLIASFVENLKRFKSEAYEERERGDRGYRRGGGGGGRGYGGFDKGPSNVIFMKGLSLDADEQYVVDLVKEFQPVKLVVFHFKGRALVEFGDEDACKRALEYLKGANILGQSSFPILVELSRTGPIREHQGVTVAPGGLIIRDENAKVANEKIVKICVKGSSYPVTAASIYGAVSPFGAPIRIATFKSFDEAVNALVEFNNAQDAANVVKALEGQFLYTGRIGLMKVNLSSVAEVLIKDSSSDRSWDLATAGGPPVAQPVPTHTPQNQYNVNYVPQPVGRGAPPQGMYGAVTPGAMQYNAPHEAYYGGAPGGGRGHQAPPGRYGDPYAGGGRGQPAYMPHGQAPYRGGAPGGGG
jgi:hypothetical protein